MDPHTSTTTNDCNVLMYGCPFDGDFNNIKAVSIGYGPSYIMYIDSENNLWSMGSNTCGELGVGDTKKRKVPTLIKGIKVKKISCNTMRAYMIDEDNYVRTTGFNTGLSGVKPDCGPLLTKPIKVDKHVSREGKVVNVPIKAKEISCGTSHNLLIDMDDNLWTFGVGGQGQLGLGDLEDQIYPKQVGDFKVKHISCGTSHSIFIDTDNNVWAFGSIMSYYFELKQDKTLQYNVPTLLKGIKAKQVASGKNHNLIIDMDNNVWAFGMNDSGQLGIGNSSTTVIPSKISHYFKDNKRYGEPIKALKVACGTTISVIIDENHDVYICGSNKNKIFPSGDQNTDYLIPRHFPGIKALDVSISSWDNIAIIGVCTN